MGILLSKEQLLQFARYTDLLLSWNEVMNLTAITELSEILDKHYLDSLSLVKALDPAWLRSGIRMIDVGTGAGFPGLPIAIAFPEAEVLLMDSLNKRIRFLEEAAKPLSNVQAVHARAEELGRQKAYRGQFDLCCSRAVADLRVLSEYCMPFVKKGGVFLSYKSEKAQEEIPAAAHAIALLGGKLERTETFSLGESAQQRSLLVIRKTKETPNVYPRKAGMPAKEPIS
ncbi:MAG: 16S rRNA (guanine(527)-N(7))-methyltransferase RsmG [Eubacteriales bacterium]|nr:16S rRNA (guanine(527)-N(7))-methyltransferase RsmG [Eubacteriales bacterium]